MTGVIFLLLSLVGFAALGCSGEDKGAGDNSTASLPSLPPANVIQVRDGSYTDGAPSFAPVADAGVPAAALDAGGSAAAAAAVAPRVVRVTGPASVTNGGTALLHVELSTPLAAPTFAVWHEGDAGYHTLVGTDPDGDGVYDIDIVIDAAASDASLIINVALLDAAGNAGPAQKVELELVASGTGDVKVTLSFGRLHDLDLHVIEPNGDEIYYQHPVTDSGGRLDLDSGLHCQPSAANGENIFWPPGAAPVGEYRVSVQNYEQCTPGDIAFSVIVEHDGKRETFDGSFRDGTAGEPVTADNVIQITSFRHER